MQIGVAGQHLASESALGCFQPQACSVGLWQICNVCSWNPVQIGVAGQPLASDLGWFDQCSWLLST